MKKTILLLLTVGLSACTMLKKPDPPQVKLVDVRVDSMSFTGAKLIFQIDAHNPNPDNITVDSLKYDLELNNKPVAKGEMTRKTELKAKSNVQVDIPVTVEFVKIFDSLELALKKPKSDYRIYGSARLGILTVPFDEKGSFEWSKKK